MSITTFFPGSTSLPTLLPPHSSEWCRRAEKKGCDQFIIFCVCCSFFLVLFCSNMGSLPWETVLRRLLQHSFLQTVVSEELLQCETFAQGAVLRGQTAAMWVALGGHRSCQKNCSCMGSSHQSTSSLRSHTSALAWSPPQSAGYLLCRLQVNLFSSTERVSLSFFTDLGV